MQNEILIGSIKLNRIGLGTNRLTENPNTQKLLNTALELGINFLDTANIYTGGESERTIGNILSPYPENLVIATKGGMVRSSPPNNEPGYLGNCVDESLARLKTDCITLYQLHRVNPETPIEETMNVLNGFREVGKIKYIGLSEVTVEQIERARSIAEIISVQNHYNLRVRKHEDVLNYCEKNNIIFIPYFPLDSGNITDNNLYSISKKYNATPYQITIAWLLKRSPVMMPIPGTLSVNHLIENNQSVNIRLSDEDFEILNKPEN